MKITTNARHTNEAKTYDIIVMGCSTLEEIEDLDLSDLFFPFYVPPASEGCEDSFRLFAVTQ